MILILFAILFTVINSHRLLLQSGATLSCNPKSSPNECDTLQAALTTLPSGTELVCDDNTSLCTAKCSTTDECTAIANALSAPAGYQCGTGTVNNEQSMKICRAPPTVTTTGSGSSNTQSGTTKAATTAAASGCDCGDRSTAQSTWSCDTEFTECQEDTSECNAFCTMKGVLDGYRAFDTGNQIPSDDVAFEGCKNEPCPATTTAAATTASGSDTTKATTATGNGATTTAAETTESECASLCADTPDSAAPDGYKCEVTEADVSPYKSAGITINAVPCTPAGNECKAKCIVTALVDETKKANPTLVSTIDTYFNVDTMTNDYCPPGTCTETATTTETPNSGTTSSGNTGSGTTASGGSSGSDTTTASGGSSGSGTTSSGSSGSDTTTATTALSCSADPNYLRTDCPDPDGTGCSLLFKVTLDVCILNNIFTRNHVYMNIKRSFKKVINLTPTYPDFCDDSDFKIELYDIEFADDAAAIAGKSKPTKDECPDPEVLCTKNSNNKYGKKIIANVGVFCGDCDDMEKLRDELLKLIENGQAAAEYITDCLGFSVDDDTICAKGFGAVQVEALSVVYRDENGDNTVIFGNHASTNYYYIGLLLVAIILSFAY